MEPTQIQVLQSLQVFLDGAENGVLIAMAIFTRISAILFMLPGFGERLIPARVKLVAALAFGVICWPAVWPVLGPEGVRLEPTVQSVGLVMIAEALVGLIIGLATRMMIFALQTAGMIAAQSLSLTQMFGAGVGPDPEPTISTMLSFGAIALALALGLHVKAVALIIYSYDAMPIGQFPLSADTADWVSARVSATFSLALSIALPFLVASFIYNLALGFINRAMPQMMVMFVGMPAIILAGIMLLAMISGLILTYWHSQFDAVLGAPFDVNPGG